MAARVTKKPSHRQMTATLGKVARDAGGNVTMIEFCEYKRDPNSPERLVNRVGGIYRFGGIIKCTFVLEAPGQNGITECVERASLLWEPNAVFAANHDFEWAFREIAKGSFIQNDDGGGRRPRHQ